MRPTRRLLAYLRRYRGTLFAGFLCICGTTGLSLAGPWVLKLAIDDLAAGRTAQRIGGYAALMLALTAVTGVFRFFQRRLIVGVSRDVEYDIRNDFFAALQRFEPGYFQRHRTGDLMSRATSDLGAVRMMIGPAFMYLSNTVLTFVAVIALMLSLNRRLTLLALIPLPPLSLLVYLIGNVIHRRFERIQEQLSTISAVAQEALSGVRVVRAYGREDHEVQRFQTANDEYVQRNRALIRIQGVFFPVMGLLMGLGVLIVLWLGSRDVIAGRMSVGELVAFNTYLLMLSWPMIAFGWVSNLLQRGSASWVRMLEVLDARPAITDEAVADAGRGAPITGALEFRHLTFSYGDQRVLEDVSAVLPAGSTTAIVGATGSGKTTLLHLVARLIDPPPGTVFVDGRDIRAIPLAELRGAIGFVSQEPFLFSATIAENIAFGVAAGVDREALARAAAIARLDTDLASFPHGLDTTVGERGITLSGGQKQRAAIARALAVDPTILILDDALSAVDTSTEQEILDGLRQVMRQRTSIIVSHRVSTVRPADQILVLDNGRIAERGTHAALLALGGLYAALARQQQFEEELAAS